MKQLKCLAGALLSIATLLSLATGALAADYTFEGKSAAEYYPSTSYEEFYGSAYNYGGTNLVDYQVPELTYGSFSTTQIGIMEKINLPGLQQYVSVSAGGVYGIESGSSEIPGGSVSSVTFVYNVPAYTEVDGMERSDGSIGMLKIPALGIDMKVWEGETSDSMAKGLGHYSSTSAWDGNIGICGHNRGAKYVIGDIKNLKVGDTITYTTIYGTRTYQVTLVEIVSNADWSYLQATADNRITITTCLAGQSEKRVCVQAVQASE